jgi:outer membrane protein assembly factor BamB
MWSYRSSAGEILPWSAGIFRDLLVALRRADPESEAQELFAVGAPGVVRWTSALEGDGRDVLVAHDRVMAWVGTGDVVAFDARSGAHRWAWSHPMPLSRGDEAYLAPLSAGRIVAVRSCWLDRTEMFTAVLDEHGQRTFSASCRIGTLHVSGSVSASPVTDAQRVFHGASRPEDTEPAFTGLLSAIQADPPKVLWARSVYRDMIPVALHLLSPEHLVVRLIGGRSGNRHTHEGVCVVDASSGTTRWGCAWERPTSPATTAHDDIAVSAHFLAFVSSVAGSVSEVQVFHPADHNPIWTVKIPPHQARLIVSGKRAFAAHTTGMVALDLASGRSVWQCHLEPPVWNSARLGEVVAVAAGASLHGICARTGAILWSVPEIPDLEHACLLAGNGHFFVIGPHEVHAIPRKGPGVRCLSSAERVAPRVGLGD